MEKFSQSLIIPTRNRSETALAAIQSALNSPYPKLQIVVSDNSDTDILYKELKSRDWLGRLTYHKTETNLSMRDNWERGLDLSTGDLVSVIGDDDAVMPDAFSIANIVFNKFDIDALKSSTAIYKWGSYPFKGRRQYLEFTMGEGIAYIKNPKEILRQGLNYEVELSTGPGLYYGFLKRGFLESIKAKRGRWIVDPVPDFDSGFAVLMYAKAFALSNRPLFVEGHSGKSNSGAMRFATTQAKNIEIFMSESGLQSSTLFVDELNKIKSNSAVIVSCQLRMLPEFRNALEDQNLNLNLIGAWNYLLKNLHSGYDTIELLASLKPLEKLANAWKVPEEAKKAYSRGDGFKGILFEQGFFRQAPPIENEPKTTATEVNRGYHKMVVNGNTLGFSSILDAVRLLTSVFPNMLTSPSAELAEEAIEYLNDKNKCRVQQALMEFDKGNFQVARRILDEVLVDDIPNVEANALLEKILLLQNDQDDQDELSKLYSMRFSRSANINDFYKTLDIYEATGQLILAKALVEGIIHNNPNLINDKKVTRFLAP